MATKAGNTWGWFVFLPVAALCCTAVLGDDFEASCDGLNDCDKCRQCAYQGECEDEQNACHANPECAAVIQAFIECELNCAGDIPCLEGCPEAVHVPIGARPPLDAMNRCADCSCISSCRIEHPPSCG